MKDLLVKIYPSGQVYLPNNILGYEGEHREFLKIKVTIYGVITRLHFFNFSFLEIC